MPIVTPELRKELSRRPRCTACQEVRINGIRCHETGCPEAWRTAIWECAWCGTEFIPDERGQRCCSEDCAEAYCG